MPSHSATGARSRALIPKSRSAPLRHSDQHTHLADRGWEDVPIAEIGVPDAHHPISHHQNDPATLAKLLKIHSFHVKLFAYFVATERGCNVDQPRNLAKSVTVE